MDKLTPACHQVIQRSNVQHTVLGNIRFTNSAKTNFAEKRNFDTFLRGISAGNDHAQGIRLLLNYYGLCQKRKIRLKRAPVQRSFSEKVEINRGPVGKAQRNGGSTIKSIPECGSLF